MPGRLTKKDVRWRQEFTTHFLAYLLGCGAEVLERRPPNEYSPVAVFRLSLLTTAGRLQITIYDIWLACRFDDVDAAVNVLPYDDQLNPHSGKWNFHFRVGLPVTECLAIFEFRFRVLRLPPQKVP